MAQRRRALIPVVTPGTIVALNPKYSGYFDDELSGILLRGFTESQIAKGQHKTVCPQGVDLSRVQHAVALGRLVILDSPDASPPAAFGGLRASMTTKARVAEMAASRPRPKDLINLEPRKILKEIQRIEDQPLLEALLQLEINGDNLSMKPRAAVVDALKERIKTYATVVAAVDVGTQKEIFREEVEKDGQRLAELTDQPEFRLASGERLGEEGPKTRRKGTK